MAFRNLLVKAGLAVAKAAAKFEPSGIASNLLDSYAKSRENKEQRNELRNELEEMLSTNFEKFRDELKEAMGELKPQIPDDKRVEVEAYLSQFQTSAKQAARVLGDPSATTVPATVSVDEPEQLAAFLPQRPPRFTVGASVPGLPSWKLVEPLGAGGFGEVWKAENPYSGIAAFKFFLDPTARNRFTRTEATNLAEIFKRAPTEGVVKLLGAEPGQDPPWLQFEYISGGDLSRLPETWKRVAVEERVKQADRVIRTLARTAGHFHNLGVVHRDLKPSNILLRKTDAGYKLVIADFGISKIVPAGLSSLPTPANSGTATIRAYTALYASPQQKKFRPADRRDDVYALGVLWYQLLRNDLNLERPSGEGWKRALKNLGVSDATIGLLNRCWDDEADERPADGNELLAAIRELDPVAVQPVQPPPIAVSAPVVPQPQLSVPVTATPTLPLTPLKPTPPALEAGRNDGSQFAPAAIVKDSAAPIPDPVEKIVRTTSPPEATATELTVEEAIREFEDKGGQRGTTATVGNQYYKTASRLRFVRCHCAARDEGYESDEFIARNARGTCYYVSHNPRTSKITIGPKGYHFCNPDVPECVPGVAPRARSEPQPAEAPPPRTIPRTGRLLGERDITPRGTWWVELPESTDDEARSEERAEQDENNEEITDEAEDDDEEEGYKGWQLVCGTPARVEIREGELYHLRLAPNGERDLTGLDALADIQQLHTINVGTGTDLPATGYSLLAGFRYLRVLNLSDTSIDDAALKFFGSLTALQGFDLSNTRIEGSGLTHLVGLLNLETLDLSRNRFGSADFSSLARIPKLESLLLSETGLTDEGLKQLRSLTNIESLDVSYTGISNMGLAHLSGMVRLSSLSLAGCSVTDAGLKHLRNLTNLEMLNLTGTKVTRKGTSEIQGALPGCDVIGK